MTDRMTPEARSRCMSKIRGKDTKPEMVVRRWLWSHGYRYRLHVRKLAGSPDIVMHRHRIVIFVNGCFWHGHHCPHGEGMTLDDSDCCRVPRSNRRFWVEKIRNNMMRDEENVARLRAEGWRVITVWECELTPKNREERLKLLGQQLDELKQRGRRYAIGADDDEAMVAAES